MVVRRQVEPARRSDVGPHRTSRPRLIQDTVSDAPRRCSLANLAAPPPAATPGRRILVAVIIMPILAMIPTAGAGAFAAVSLLGKDDSHTITAR